MTRRTLGTFAACLVVAGLVVGGLASASSSPREEGPPLVFSIPGKDVSTSQAIGTFSLSESGCLYFGGDVAVLPTGSSLDGDRVHLTGLSSTTVPLGEEVTIGGARLELAYTDVIENLVEPDDRAEFDRCARESGTDAWVLVT